MYQLLPPSLACAVLAYLCLHCRMLLCHVDHHRLCAYGSLHTAGRHHPALLYMRQPQAARPLHRGGKLSLFSRQDLTSNPSPRQSIAIPPTNERIAALEARIKELEAENATLKAQTAK